MKKFLSALILIALFSSATLASADLQIENLPVLAKDGSVSFEKMTDKELSILYTLLEEEISLRQLTTSAPTSTDTGTATLGEKNALRSAENYLSLMPFSYNGLIHQLEYEGYSKTEATYAADHCGADWNEQAAKCAQNYMSFMSFSKKGLIDQLKYEGFTQQEAEYGVKEVGY